MDELCWVGDGDSNGDLTERTSGSETGVDGSSVVCYESSVSRRREDDDGDVEVDGLGELVAEGLEEKGRVEREGEGNGELDEEGRESSRSERRED